MTHMTLSSSQHAKTVKKDAGLTALLGPVCLIATMAGTLILYRIVIARAGLEVIGLWTILNVAAAFISLVDIGFSQVLVREIHVADGLEGSTNSLLDKHAAEQVYRWFLWLVAIPAALAAGWLLPGVPYDRGRFCLALVLTAWGAVIQLQAGLEASVLAALQENARIQAVNTAAAVLSLAVAILGSYLDAPIEGFALGNLCAALLTRSRFQRRVAGHGLMIPRTRLAPRELVARAGAMARRGGYFYSISLGTILREPLFRITIAYFLGVKALGVYAIALRASVAARDVVAGGFAVLYPAMASLNRAGNRKDSEALQVASVIVLTVFGWATLGCLYGLAEPVLAFLLGSLPEGLVNATRILVVWNLITLFNVPFCHLLEATGHEKASSASLWVHTLAIMILWPLQSIVHLSLNGVLYYWTITSLATQAVIYYNVEKQLDRFLSVLRNRSVSMVILFAFVYFGIIISSGSFVSNYTGTMPDLLFLAATILFTTIIFMASAIAISWPTLKRYWQQT
jgi:O-antigen/teichoic acid export membrane protein